MKRWVSAAVLLVLVALVVIYVVAMSDPPNQFYSAKQRQILSLQSRMRLNQVAPISNYYVGELESGTATLVSSMGAVECRVRATLDARYEENEGITATVYDLDFSGTYRLRHTGPTTVTLELIFPFPEGLDTLNQVHFLVKDEAGELQEPPDVRYSLDTITWRTELVPGEEREVTVGYRARGVGSFTYALDRNRRLENLDVTIAVRGLAGSETPDDFLPTTSVEEVEGGQQFTWRYEALIADRDIRVELPARMGFAQRVEALREPLLTLSLASPFLVALFVACLAGLHRLSGVRLPFIHYLLAGLGTFLFYPALTFLAGLLELPLAAAVAVASTTTLLAIFLARAAGWRHTWWSTLLLAVTFLGLFSLGAMSDLRGLLLTAGGLVLVATFMVLAARYRPTPKPAQESQEPQDEAGEPENKAATAEAEAAKTARAAETAEVTGTIETTEAAKATEPCVPDVPARYCPHCGAGLEAAFAFCPACGRDATAFRRCPACGAEHYAPPEAEMDHCPACGKRMENEK